MVSLHINQSINFIKYVQKDFLFFWLLIGIFLFLILYLVNLIYLTIDLGIISLTLVITWLHLLEVNFILLAYILAFIGAVVMLILSVVLMLPASTFYNFLFVNSIENVIHYFYYNWLCILFIHLFILFLIIFSILNEKQLSILFTNLHHYNRYRLSNIQDYEMFLFKKIRFHHRADLPNLENIFSLSRIFLTLRYILICCLLFIDLLVFVRIPTVITFIRKHRNLLINHLRDEIISINIIEIFITIIYFFSQLFYNIFFLTLILCSTTIKNPQLNISPEVVYNNDLVAIKQILYVDNPILLIVSLFGLLIALLGTTLINNKTIQQTQSRLGEFGIKTESEDVSTKGLNN